MIDALEAVINLLLADSGISAHVSDRVASRHRFGEQELYEAWPTPEKGIQVGYDNGGRPDVHVDVENFRLDIRCYGPDEADAGGLYNALVGFTRDRADRKVIATSNGNAFVYWVTIDASPQNLRDPDLSMDYVQTYLAASVADYPVP